MILARGLSPSRDLWVPLVLAIAWAFAMVMAADLGPSAYAFPLLPLALLAIGWLASLALRGEPKAIGFFLVFVVFVLSLNFRTRTIGDDIGMDWQNGLKFASWALMLLIAIFHVRLFLPLLRQMPLLLPFLYASFALVSSLWSPVPAYTAANAIGIFAYLGLACAVATDLADSAAIRVLLWTLLVYIIVGIVGGIIVPDIAWMPPSVEETTYRLRGFSGHPNNFGLQLGIFMTLTVIARRNKLVGQPIFWGMLILGSAAILVASGSRTSLLAFLLAWLFVAMRQSRFGGMVAFALLTGAAMLILIRSYGDFSVLEELLGGISRTGSANEITTLTGRTDIWAVVLEKTAQKPFLGWGYNGTEGLISSSVGRAFVGNPVNAHNMALQTLISVGIIGSLPAFGFIALLIWRCIRRPDPTRDQIIAFWLVIGFGEAEIFTTPGLLALLVFWCLAREARTDASFTQPSTQGAIHGEPRIA
jgi:O-antigen ligase